MSRQGEEAADLSTKQRPYDEQLQRKGARLAYRVKERVPFCWMCRATTGMRAKEHIFPLWLQKQLGAQNETWAPTHMDYLGRVVSTRGSHRTTALLAGEVCARCNGGWMNDLEGRFRAVMFPRRAVIDGEEGAVIAHWFAKTAIVLNTAQNYRLMIPRTARHAVKQAVPPGMGVWLARMPNQATRLGFAQSAGGVITVVKRGMAGVASEYLDKAYVCALRVDDVLAAVVYAPPGPWAWPAEDMIQLHPWRDQPIAWESLPQVDEIWAPLTLYGDHPDLSVGEGKLSDERLAISKQPVIAPE